MRKATKTNGPTAIPDHVVWRFRHAVDTLRDVARMRREFLTVYGPARGPLEWSAACRHLGADDRADVARDTLRRIRDAAHPLGLTLADVRRAS
jgi:hypothetical protein